MQDLNVAEFTKSLRVGATSLILWCELAAVAASASAAPRAFENGLRRAIAVQGQEQARFTLAQRMAHYRVPGTSVAVIDRCRIVDARGFGTFAGGGPKVTPHSLFQAGSISKSVSAVAALRLVDQRKLQLDSDVRPLVKGWALEDSPQLAASLVTLRRLLNHTAGLNEVGGKGYERGAPLPTLTEILNGVPPANTPPIHVEKVPGSEWGYSSGGYYVAQALMTDVTGEPFPILAKRLVLSPAGMHASTFAQPLAASRSRLAATAVGPDGSPMAGGWRVNPELAAGGLWTTPTDLARFLITLTRDLRGENHRLLSRARASELMAPGLKNWGLGVELGSPDGPRRIGHTGHNVGYVSEYIMYPDTCQGAVVMTNADQGGWLVTEILRAIGDAYGWPEARPSPVQATVRLTDVIAQRFVGSYRLRDFPAEGFTISRKPDGGLYWARNGYVGRDLLPEHAGRLFSPDSRMTLDAVGPADAKAATLELSFGGGKNIAERVE
jgi:CubicO group peptidase (beta-lactamase class C family)